MVTPSAGQRIGLAFKKIAPIVGSMALALECQRGIPRPVLASWVKALRETADELEKLL